MNKERTKNRSHAKLASTKITHQDGSWMKVLSFLTEHDKTRYSRIDAFCYLINRLAYNRDSANGQKQSDDRSFVTSISELADIWHWQRISVRKFLAGLEAINQIQRESDGRHIKLHILGFDSLTASKQCWSDTEVMMAVDLITECIRCNRMPSDIDNENEFSPSELQYLDKIAMRMISHLQACPIAKPED